MSRDTTRVLRPALNLAPEENLCMALPHIFHREVNWRHFDGTTFGFEVDFRPMASDAPDLDFEI
jgi:hypothetical protein